MLKNRILLISIRSVSLRGQLAAATLLPTLYKPPPYPLGSPDTYTHRKVYSLTMVHATGTLRINRNQTIEFVSQDGKVKLQGTYAQALPRDVQSPAFIDFNGPSGAVTLRGMVGEDGIHLRLSGPTGNGLLAGAFAPLPPTAIEGNANIEVNN